MCSLFQLSLSFDLIPIVLTLISQICSNSAPIRALGEFGYIRHFSGDGLAIKLSYTPIWYDHGGDDVQYIPVSFTFRATL
jgi:hypothetical protein